ncbi:MAG TPA: MoaD/ThiS family protein [Gammaproteobacteria bacterium]|jgi:molybdopterin converting factor small subunit|nr:MoaD/ThiS family protein [Arenicellales bacterium]HIF79086.1 MoaD/ThiS family protein [Gammaproteobacteria bacterium]HIM06565.1 MoaD/ThiS family protein [Gammaproteobacteria bacterium]|tara:strand:+ start:117 stop:362 length:246 start_codon:yes stop_codon:yes gene_type:complete
MARIVLSGNLRLYTEGVTELELESGSIRSLIRELRRRYPDIPEDIEDELAISIDGVLHQDDWFAKIGPDSEVHLLPRISGG